MFLLFLMHAQIYSILLLRVHAMCMLGGYINASITYIVSSHRLNVNSEYSVCTPHVTRHTSHDNTSEILSKTFFSWREFLSHSSIPDACLLLTTTTMTTMRAYGNVRVPRLCVA